MGTSDLYLGGELAPRRGDRNRNIPSTGGLERGAVQRGKASAAPFRTLDQVEGNRDVVF